MTSSGNLENGRGSLTAFAAARNSDIAFPAYRFIPGQNPHPTADPRGHSFRAADAPSPPVTWVSPQEWADSDEYLYGCDLYNHAYWWEAHEAWEGLWQLSDKGEVQGRFLQGLIQASACHLKRFVGHTKGVERLRRTSLGYLRRVVDDMAGETYMGLDLVAFVKRFEAYYRAWELPMEGCHDHDPRAYPYLQLNVEQEDVSGWEE